MRELSNAEQEIGNISDGPDFYTQKKHISISLGKVYETMNSNTPRRMTAIMFSEHSGIFGQMSARLYNNFFPNEENL